LQGPRQRPEGLKVKPCTSFVERQDGVERVKQTVLDAAVTGLNKTDNALLAHAHTHQSRPAFRSRWNKKDRLSTHTFIIEASDRSEVSPVHRGFCCEMSSH